MKNSALSAELCGIRPQLPLILEIEEELGGLAALALRLAQGEWRVGELVTLVQILLQSAGHETDFVRLGNDMIAQGLELYRRAALGVLEKAVGIDIQN